mgnify:CR=1 FL=1
MLEINLKQLEAFVTTAEYSSFTKAAEALYLTQSTVSAHINSMEQTLGVRLIQRGSRRKVQLTTEGKQAYDMAKAGFKEASVRASSLTDALTDEQVKLIQNL